MRETPLGQHLLVAGLINADQLRIALIEQEKKPQPLGELLHQLGFAAEALIHDVLARQLAMPRFNPGQEHLTPDALDLVPESIARRYRLLPLSLDRQKQHLRLAMSHPNNPQHIAGLQGTALAGMDLEIVLAGDTEIEQGINQYYGQQLAIDDLLGELERRSQSIASSGEGPAVRLIDALLTDAVHRQASDIHFEPESACLRIRYRIDGVLESIRILHKASWPALSSRLKILAGMNIAETRAPQDGRISQDVTGRRIDFRVASQPTIHGENIVLRILDRQKGIVPLDQLNLDDSQRQLLERMLARPEGLLLATGPTGSGKTTTLYSLLNQLNRESVHIMTLEDPVEYPFPLIRQTSLSDNCKLDFANGVRSMLRQDPDIILIGEIRDSETAAMALRAALTGHQVHATLHASNAIAALARLEELGIDRRLLHGNLIGIIAQRLVRRLCPHCQTTRPASPAETARLGVTHLPQARGCPHCHQQGYRGRIPLLEILRIDQPLDDLLAHGARTPQLVEQARLNGFQPLLDCGLQRLQHGETTLEELARVVDLSAWDG